MKHLIIHGDWVIKDAFYHNLGIKNKLQTDGATWFGGTIGFIEQVGEAIEKTKAERVVVFWDGILFGKNKYDTHPIIKRKRMNKWNLNMDIISNSVDEEDKKNAHSKELFYQKLLLKQVLDDVFVRSVEFDDMEAHDMMTFYKEQAIKDGDEVFIYGKPANFQNLISDDVYLYVKNNGVVKKENFQELFHYDQRNSFLMFCILGDDQRDIIGLEGIGHKKLLKFFPMFQNDKFSYGDLMKYCSEKNVTHPLKIYDEILNSYERILENFRVLNENFIYLTSEAKSEIIKNLYSPLYIKERSIETIKSFLYERIYYDKRQKVDSAIIPYYYLMTKEIEYSNLLDKISI